MIKLQQNEQFFNKIKLNGTVVKKDGFVNFAPFPIFGMEIKTKKTKELKSMYRFTNNEDLTKPDETKSSDYFYFRIIFINQPNVINEFEIGDRITLLGEIQSRNYFQFYPLSDTLIQNAVDIYQNLFNKIPTKEEPTQFIRQPIHWEPLLDLNLLEGIPSDSLFIEDGKKSDDPNNPYLYKIDWNGEVTKETRETIIEVIVLDYKKEEKLCVVESSDSSLIDSNPLEKLVKDDQLDTNITTESNIESDENLGDEEVINDIFISGRVASTPNLEVQGANVFTEFKVQTYIPFFEKKEERLTFITVKATGGDAEKIFNTFEYGQYIQVYGSLVSEMTNHTFRVKKITASNKKKTKKIVITKTDRFILTNAKNIKKQGV